MNDVKFVAFNQQSAIGTKDLAGCSVLTIASKYGAILAHIPPRPIPNTPDPYAGDQNVQRLMGLVDSLYNQHRNYFPDPDTYAIFAIYQGQVALPDQKKIIEDGINNMGLQPHHNILYVTPRDPTDQAHGTVLVDSLGRGALKPIVYSEDRQVSSDGQPPGSQSPWTWSTEHRRYYRWVMKDGAMQPEWAPLSS